MAGETPVRPGEHLLPCRHVPQLTEIRGGR